MEAIEKNETLDKDEKWLLSNAIMHDSWCDGFLVHLKRRHVDNYNKRKLQMIVKIQNNEWIKAD